MTVRTGLQDIIDEVQLQIGNSTLLSEDNIQSILDKHKKYLKKHNIKSEPIFTNGSYEYYEYIISYPYLESGSVFRLFDNDGDDVDPIALYADIDYLNGKVIFDTNQAGTIYYIDAVTYDFHAAVAECWRLIAAQTAHMYDFTIQDRRFNRDQWFKHCQAMIAYHSSLTTFSSNISKSIPIIRGDLLY